jgi:lysophospholipase L1-like esterase
MMSSPREGGDVVGAPSLRKFLDRGRPVDGRRVVVCAGDSLTHGKASGDWVGLLQDQLGSREFVVVNAGWSGYLSASLLREIDDVVAARPDIVTVLIGSNDVMATTSDGWLASYQRQDPPATPTIETYREWLDELVRRLVTETSARVALLDLPPISEDLGSMFNRRVNAFNEVVREVAAAHGAEVLPLNARLSGLIAAASPAPEFDGTGKDIKSSLLQHFLLRRRWDKISARAGRTVLTDNIHLNDRAAAEVAALVKAFVEGAGSSAGPTATVGP